MTQRQYEQAMGTNPSHFAPMGEGKDAVAGMDTAGHPVEFVRWTDAAEFCAKLSQQENLKPNYFRAGETVTSLDGNGYRLPTEAEWEFACRAGTMTEYWNGGKDIGLTQSGWWHANSGARTHAVGELKANPFGLYDVHGNVWEWVQDGWEQDYYTQFQAKPAVDPSGPAAAGGQRMLRGGGCLDRAYGCRGSSRDFSGVSARYRSIGFRVAIPVDAVREQLARTQAPATNPAGADQGLTFAAGGHVELPSLPALSNSRFCVEAHVTPLDAPPGAFGQVLDAPGQVMLRITGPDQWEFAFLTSDRTVTPGPARAEKGRRVHLAATRDGDTLAFYVDGKRVSSYSEPDKKLEVVDRMSKTRLGEAFPGIIHQLRVSKAPRYDGEFQPSDNLQPDEDTEAL